MSQLNRGYLYARLLRSRTFVATRRSEASTQLYKAGRFCDSQLYITDCSYSLQDAQRQADHAAAVKRALQVPDKDVEELQEEMRRDLAGESYLS